MSRYARRITLLLLTAAFALMLLALPLLSLSPVLAPLCANRANAQGDNPCAEQAATNAAQVTQIAGLQGTITALEARISTLTPMQTIDAEGLLHQWASSATATSEYGNPSWAAAQAVGVPDTNRCGDITTAWASATSTGKDRLTLSYAQAVRPTQVNVFETYNPGAITSISLVRADGDGEIRISDSADSSDTPCPGVFTVDLPDDMPLVNGVTLHLDQALTGSWNEIDAVELVGRAPQ
jgi:hypothetical protein